MPIHIVGPIAWDSIIETHENQSSESIIHAKLKNGRPGGQGLNVACALKSAGLDVVLHGYVGDDDHGVALKNYMNSMEIDMKFVSTKPVATAHVLVMIDNNGERSMTGLQKSYAKEVKIDAASVCNSDFVIWPVWFSAFREDLELIKNIGARAAIGLRGVTDEQAKAEILITSDIEEITERALANYSRAYISSGSQGGLFYSNRDEWRIGAPRVDVVDTTGAGDAFMSGVIWGEIQGRKPLETLKIAILWGSYATEMKSSVPPTFSQLKSRFPAYSELFN